MINSRATTLDVPDGDGADPLLQPLSPRSIVLSVLLGQHPPEMPVGHLLAFTAVFGIADGTVRTALSRLTAAGDLVADDGTYRLSERLVSRQAEQDAGRVLTEPGWDGDWWFAVAAADRRTVAERRDFRARLSGARFGELRPDIWIRPANIDVALAGDDVLLTRGPLVNGDADGLVDRLWDLEGLDRTAAAMCVRLDETIVALAAPVSDDELPPAFHALAAAQRFLRTEPQLPAALSARRSADELRRRYAAAARAFQRALDAFFARQ